MQVFPSCRYFFTDDVIQTRRSHRRTNCRAPVLQPQPLFDEKEKANVLYADRVTRAATPIRAAELEDLHKYYDEGQIVELTLVICMANFTNRFNDALENILELGV